MPIKMYKMRTGDWNGVVCLPKSPLEMPFEKLADAIVRQWDSDLEEGMRLGVLTVIEPGKGRRPSTYVATKKIIEAAGRELVQ